MKALGKHKRQGQLGPQLDMPDTAKASARSKTHLEPLSFQPSPGHLQGNHKQRTRHSRRCQSKTSNQLYYVYVQVFGKGMMSDPILQPSPRIPTLRRTKRMVLRQSSSHDNLPESHPCCLSFEFAETQNTAAAAPSVLSSRAPHSSISVGPSKIHNLQPQPKKCLQRKIHRV